MLASTWIKNNPVVDTVYRIPCRYYVGGRCSFDGTIQGGGFQIVVYRGLGEAMGTAIDFFDENNLQSDPMRPVDVDIGGDDSTQGVNLILRLGPMVSAGAAAVCIFYVGGNP